ncbi:hypothetical protein C8J57DRAFT_1307300 [Mycena rebaudengoi]|nr:hypothetical protein C8J57DRAFT_1307300 [Mycena rebaudengoi]
MSPSPSNFRRNAINLWGSSFLVLLRSTHTPTAQSWPPFSMTTNSGVHTSQNHVSLGICPSINILAFYNRYSECVSTGLHLHGLF